MYSIDVIKRKKNGMLLYPFTDFWFCMLRVPSVYNKDGAKRRHNFRHFRQFRHFRHYKTCIQSP